jgi:hypothetical protein
MVYASNLILLDKFPRTEYIALLNYYLMKQTLTLTLLFTASILFAQLNSHQEVPSGMWNTAPLSSFDEAAFDRIEELTLPDGYRNKSLPDSIDNSEYSWFRRPIFAQTSYMNCMQSTSIAYNFTYEINRLRDQSGSNPDHQYTTHFAWNFYNGGNGWYGVNYLQTMDVLQYHGTPSITDYGGFYAGGGSRWMSGYDEWYNAMNNRISDIKKIYVGDEEGILTLKHWLVNHLDGSETGGLASFIACSPWDMTSLPPESPHAGKNVIVYWCPEALHGMTIVGYNDSIRFDYNKDGKYTNDIDINHDGVLDVKDWEIGALKFCNSYGDTWADSGFCYMMYRTLAEDFGAGGIWTNTVHVLNAKAEHNTRMTYKVSLEHDYRGRIRVQAGISSDLNSNKPEHIHNYTIFNYQGGWHYMQGIDTLPDYKTIEFGLDVTPLLSYVDPGKAYKFFLIIDEKDPENLGTGQVKGFSLIDYQNGINEIACNEHNVPLVDNGRTLLSITYEPTPNDLLIVNESLPLYVPGQPLQVQLNASGGEQPYNWLIDKNYVVNITEAPYPEINENKIIVRTWEDSLAMQPLEFEFPFYDNVFDTVVVSSSGYVYFDENMYFWSYIVDNAYFLRNSRAVAPLLCQKMHVYDDDNIGVWYEGDENVATFRWSTEISGEEISELNFAVSLYPDGKIEFYYGAIELHRSIQWTAGIADGDLFNYSIPDLPDPQMIPAGSMVEFFPVKQPEYVSLSNEGILEITEQAQNKLSNVMIILTDNTLLSARKSFPLTDGLEIKLTQGGREELSISNGQISYMDLELLNRGDTSYEDLIFMISNDHPLLNITDEEEHILLLGAGESLIISDAFSIYCDKNMPDEQTLMIDLIASGMDVSYSSESQLRTLAPSIKLGGVEVLNEIGRLDPGETDMLKIRLVNAGNRTSINTIATISSDHEGLSINTEQPVNAGTIGAWEDASIEINVTASLSIAFGTEVNFTIELTDEIGLVSEIPFSMRIGRTPVFIVDMDLSIGSGTRLQSVLDNMDIEYDYTSSWPLSISNYQSVFLSLGKQFTNHTLTWQQSEMLAAYLNNGGNLFMEGRMIWEQFPHVPILDRFNVSTVSDPGMYEILDGVDSTFTEGLSFENDAPQPFCFFYLEPVTPAFTVFVGREYPYSAMVAYDAGSYKTIASILELGYFVSSDSCKVDSLIIEVLEFFEIKQGVTGIDEIPEGELTTSFQNYPNPFQGETYIPLILEERSFVDARIYDLQGRRISTLFPAGMLEQGSYRMSWDARDEAGKEVPGGVYLYYLLVDDKQYTGKMVLIR